MELNKIYHGDCLEVLKTFPSESIDCVVTSPPYWNLRDYGVKGQLGLEATFKEYLNKLIEIFNEVYRVLKEDGTCWVNIGDSYSYKCLSQIPSHFAISMTNNGWILRNEIIWHKPNAMPSSVSDRFTVDYEKLFFFTKSQKYYFNQQKEQMKTNVLVTKSIRKHSRTTATLKQDNVGRSDYTGFNDRYTTPSDYQRNKRAMWSINTKPTKELHFAVFPEALIETPIKAGCKPDGVVLDPFIGSGTTAVVAKKLGFNFVGIELNQDYIKIAEKRIQNTATQQTLKL